MNIKRYILLRRAGLSAEALYYAQLGGASVSDETLMEMIKKRRYQRFMKVKSFFFRNKKKKAAKKPIKKDLSFAKKVKSLSGKSFKEIIALKLFGIDVEYYRKQISNLNIEHINLKRKYETFKNEHWDQLAKIYTENPDIVKKSIPLIKDSEIKMLAELSKKYKKEEFTTDNGLKAEVESVTKPLYRLKVDKLKNTGYYSSPFL
jgi:hypothetical protein